MKIHIRCIAKICCIAETPPISIPKTYISYEMSSEHPVIVMEDIKEATVVDIVAGFDEKQVSLKWFFQPV